ncbi:SPW repeat domain-containing protein [Gemmata sp.]|uniref:SPW repeat domain-containing protein n=1 Tax=Gemmata sp. TaxID=1914242 RepID=UPI003F6F80A6
MRFVPTSIHGPIDYLFGLALIAAPWIGRFAANGAETWVPVAIGALVIGQSLLTDYEWSAARVVPMPVHLWNDAGAGAFLAVSPWLFGFADAVWVPHLVFGLLEVGLALCTERAPGAARATMATAPAGGV